MARRLREPRVMPFAEYAVHRGMLSPCERALLLRRQRALQPRIGGWFVEQGVVGEEQLEHLLHCARQMNAARGAR
jgi:hypothetical protein